MFIFVDMKIFVEIYFIRTSGNAASLVAPPSEAAAGVPLIGLEANRRYWWVGIEDITSSLLTPNCNIVETYQPDIYLSTTTTLRTWLFCL